MCFVHPSKKGKPQSRTSQVPISNVQMCQIGRNCRKKVTLDQMSKLCTKEEVQQFLGLHGRILPDIEPSLLYLHMIRKAHL